MIDVELRNVTKQFGSVVAVDKVSLQVRQGEFLTLLGPSGCGKTTTMRLIAGLETPTSGEILIREECVTDLPPYHRNVSLMFQNYALFPTRTSLTTSFGLGKVPWRSVSSGSRKVWPWFTFKEWNHVTPVNSAVVSNNGLPWPEPSS
jgi:ABC-type Fe3+/spermidine/putrescine transport system ATPase subunit